MNPTDRRRAEIGRTVIGPLVHGFARQVERWSEELGVERLYFLTREGPLLLDAFTQVSDRPAELLEVSRRSLVVPRLANPFDENDLSLLTGGKAPRTVAVFLRRVGLDPAVHAGAVAAEGFSGLGHVVRTSDDRGRLARLFSSLSGEVVDALETERCEAAKKFAACHPGDAHAAIVDLGWHISMQRAIEAWWTETGQRPKVTGMYVGTYDVPPAGFGHAYRSWLVHDARPAERLAAVQQAVDFLEVAISSPDGTVLGYDGDEVVRGPAHPDEAEIRVLQSAARSVRAEAAIEDPDVAVALLTGLFDEPDRTTAEAIGALRHAEGFGGEEPYVPLLDDAPLNARDPRVAARALGNTWWRAGLLRLLVERRSLVVSVIGLRLLWVLREILRSRRV